MIAADTWLTPSLLGYISGALGAIIAIALVVTLTTVLMLLLRVGGSNNSHVVSIAESLSAVGDSTAPVPSAMPAINHELGELAAVLTACEGHLANARSLFDQMAHAK
jgi:hypothetical protein